MLTDCTVNNESRWVKLLKFLANNYESEELRIMEEKLKEKLNRITFDGMFCELALCKDMSAFGNAQLCFDGMCSRRKVWERLKILEDILGPTYDLSRIKELVEADREGEMRGAAV